MKFRNRTNVSGSGALVVNRVEQEDELVLIPGQVLKNHEIMRRGLYGTIVDKVVPGTFFESDYDLEKIQDMDIIDKAEFVKNSTQQIGELESYRDSLIEQGKLKAIEDKRLSDEAEEKRISALIDKKKISGKD